MADNGTNISLKYSFDNVVFTTVLDETRGTFFTTGPNEVGLSSLNFGSGATQGMSYASWVQA